MSVRLVEGAPLKTSGAGDMSEGRPNTPGVCLQESEAAERVPGAVGSESEPVGGPPRRYQLGPLPSS
ncbi:hypothetical protein CRG98_008174 [Punica granatum]|uniref:Uncharacterized protein n=1 Tax=Punica granatum TaxID=22663 RepID=A0A2I0KSI3_PUNGR|nr:hypothetical protein CRG98_008174 [Punica granatum]